MLALLRLLLSSVELCRAAPGILNRCVLPVLSALMLAGCHGEAPPHQDAPPRPVKTFTVGQAMPDAGAAPTGDIQPHDETGLAFRIDGRLLTRRVEVGSAVKGGEVIATLDAPSTANQLQSARADLSSALSAERLARLNTDRMEALAGPGAVARNQLDQARDTFASAAARASSARASLKTAEEQESYRHLTAPFDGVITAVDANPGQVMSAGQQVVRIASSRGKDAVFDLPQSLITPALSQAEVRVSLLSDAGVAALAHLRDISPQADPSTRTWRVRFALDDPSVMMTYGAAVRGDIARTTAHSMVIPASALTRQGEAPAVYLVDAGRNTLRLQSISVARYSPTEIFVSHGLRAGDRVVTAGVSKLRPNEKVSLMEVQ